MTPETLTSQPATNRFDRMEIAGAFGDLGTLIPFVVAYLAVLKMDPFGVLFAFGISMLVCGFVYRTPMPVQPMKAAGAIATTQAAQTLTLTPAMVHGASLVTGLIWLVLGLTGTAHRVANLVKRPIVVGITLGLGFGFMIEGAKMMAQNWWIGGVALLGTSLLLTNRVIPAMFVLLLFGATYGIWSDPTLLDALRTMSVEPRLPTFALSQLTWNDLMIGAVFLALPQVPLTLGNAVIAITEENNRLFPNRPVTEGKISTSTGLMNLFSAGVGGVPMCHGAGGMAGHVQFGARTGGAVVILGAVLLLTAVLFSGSVGTLLRLFPPSVLGVILFLTGAQLALGSCDLSKDKGERFVTVITAALAVWNVGIAFVVGMAAYALNKKGWLRV
jgi:Molybdate transporter of MFS superfamily